MLHARRRSLATTLVTSLLVATLTVTGLPLLRSIVTGGGVDVVSREVGVAIDRQSLVRLPIAASHVVLRWSGDHEAQLTLALGRTSYELSEDIAAGHDDLSEGADDETWSQVIWADGARWARVTTDRPIRDLAVMAMDTDAARGIDDDGVVSAAVTQPALITRAGWGANEGYAENSGGYIRFAPSFDPLQKMIVHHTAGRNNDPNPAATIRAIYYNHAVQRGYGDIDYNFLVDAQGKVYEGRRAWIDTPAKNPIGEDLAGNVVRGAHARNYNDATVGIALLGNFTNVMPTSAARTALINLLAWKAERHGMDPKGQSKYVNPVNGTTRSLYNISGHRNVNSTACPGLTFYNWFPSLRQAVADKIAATTGPAVDETPPKVVSFASLGTDPSGAHTQRFGLIFKEPVTGLEPDDLTVTGSSEGWAIDDVQGTASRYTVTVVADENGGGPEDGTVTLTLAADGVTDKAGHTGPAEDESVTVEFAAETDGPTAILYAVPTKPTPVGRSYSVSVLFDEPVTGFDDDDIVLGGSSHDASPWTFDLIYGSGGSYNVTIYNETPKQGKLTIQIATGDGLTDLAGNPIEGSNVITRLVDLSAPTTTKPKASLRANTTLKGGQLRVKLTWTGTDAGPAGVASYDVRRSRDGKAYSTIATGLTNPSLGWPIEPGHTYRFQVRARDKAGNVGAWKTGPLLKPALVQQSSTAIKYQGSTKSTSYRKYSGGSQRYLGAAGSSATFTTSARNISFVTTRGLNRGSAKVYIDGVLAATLDLAADTNTFRFVAFSKTWSSVGTHTIRIVSVGTPVPRVDIDAFGVIR
ncbi:MAG TPA: N-acetylmuramoyl-L-alanine amidase [Candidatus Limnocylindria bacterium]|nr:N-acetylmuramoyl-L-alanine amidase [Candidatus Limnocylindria bacterium]